MLAIDDQYGVLYERTGLVENLRQYFITITTAAMICGLITAFADKSGSCGKLLRMLCGIFMAVTILSPLIHLRFGDIELYLEGIQYEGELSAEAGVLAAKEEMSSIIKDNVEAYILDKASSMGLMIEVEVTLSGENLPKPQVVYIKGTVPPYAKSQLKHWLKDTLGIGEENQIWQ